MADRANSTSVPAVHALEGSTPPGDDTLDKLRATHAPKARPRLDKHPLGLRDVSPEKGICDLSRRLVETLRREPALVRKLDMLRLHSLLPDKQVVLEKVLGRTWRRIDRWTKRLAATNAPTTRATAMKAAAVIETAVVYGRLADLFDALAISLAHDVGHLALEAASIPQHVGGNFAGYHRAILDAHAAMEAQPPGATDADSDPYMDRWGEIDRLAMMDRPRTFSDAVAALAYARREFHQFHVEMAESAGEDICPGDKLILHLLDGAAAVLRWFAQEDRATSEFARPEELSSLMMAPAATRAA